MIFFRNQKKIFVVSFFVAAFLFNLSAGMLVAVPQAKADCWGCTMAAAIMKQTMETIQRQIEGALLGSLKVAAVQMLNTQVGQLIGGNSVGQALFITNYNDFLYQGPAQRTDLYMNDFFTLTTRGKGASANYIGAGNTGGIGGNYPSYLESVGRQSTTGVTGINTYSLEEYTPSPDAMFAEGDWRAFNAFFSNPANNPYGYSLQTERVYQNKLAQEQQMAMVKAMSSGGFLPAEKNGMVVTPAGSIEAVLNNAQDLPNKVIAAASNPAELLSGVVSAMANRMIGNLVQRGVGQVQSNIQREVGNVTSGINSASNGFSQQLGPGAQFMNSAAQRVNVNVNSSTPPPAAQ